MGQESSPKDPSALADYQRHLVVFGDPTKLKDAQGEWRAASQDFVNELLQHVLEKFNPTELDEFRVENTGFWLFYLGAVQFTVGEAISIAEEKFAPEMTFARNGRVSFLQATINDPLYARQWALRKIEVEPAWQRLAQAASKPVRLAIIDSGIKHDHPDFVGLPIVEHNVITGMTGTGSSPDDTGHGTMLAGTVGAVINNAIGIAGVVPSQPSGPVNLTLIAIKFDGARTPPTAYFAAKAVYYAAGFGMAARRAEVINASWHLLDDKALLLTALSYAQGRGVLVVSAAGNYGGDNTRIPTIPASYAFGNMIAVMASNHFDDKTEFSNYGATVDLAAPGESVLSTGLYFLNSAYRDYSGTSVAAAHVSAAAALLLAIDTWTPSEIRDHLVASADPVPDLSGICRAGGRLNVRRAVCGPFEIIQPRGGLRVQRNSFYDVHWRSHYHSPVIHTIEISINGFGALTGAIQDTGVHRLRWPNLPIANAVLRLRCVQKNLYAESLPFEIV